MKEIDLCITDVRNNEKGVLLTVLACTLNDGELSEKFELSKNQVIDYIENGFLIKTIYERRYKEWVIGSTVNVVLSKGNKYLRTDGNSIGNDNLDNLPTY